jgi:hypothetical protein
MQAYMAMTAEGCNGRPDFMDTERKLSPQAQRALAEAQARRLAQPEPKMPREINGRAGPEPTRFGDWENKGIASDF